MTSVRNKAPIPCRPGFTLAAVLVMAGALLVLALSALLIASTERGTARIVSDRERAALAARAGLEEIRSRLTQETADDGFVVLQSTLDQPLVSGREPAPYLFLAKPASGMDGGHPIYRYVPLFSAADNPQDRSFTCPEVEPLLPENEYKRIDFQTLPYLDSVRTAWVPVRDDRNRIVGRYAYWVEDLQSRVDPASAGNTHGEQGTHARVAWPFPAAGSTDPTAGVSRRNLDQIALFAVDPETRDGDQGSMGKALLRNRTMLISPDSTQAAAENSPPLIRLAEPSPDGGFAGDLADPAERAVERGLGAGARPYLEQARIPHTEGISTAAAGQRKLNLNALLTKNRAAAIEEIAAHIRRALPEFDARMGGFPDDYVKTLAANAMDYADADSGSSTSAGYRGIDAFPLVSEFVFRSTWESIRTEGGRKFLELSTTVYVELWNMTNLPVQGQAQVSYENHYSFRIPPDPNDIFLSDLTHATHDLSESDGYHWFPAMDVALQPNECKVYRCGTVRYSFDAAAEDGWIESPKVLEGESYAARGSGYRMRWNGVLADQSRGGVHRNDSFLRYPSAAKQGRHVNRLTVPGHSYNRGGTFLNNMGDPRMSAYLAAPQDANSFPQNYSPHRRNLREGSIYTTPARHDLIYGRVLPSEWPDGGHDAPFGCANMHGLFGMTATSFADDHRIAPDDERFGNEMPDLSRGAEEAPVRISNRGTFFSATELGHIHDPVMWKVRATNETSNPPGTPWGDVLASSVASSEHGGGNTLRIGRPEHPRFDTAGMRASQLLDLFHTGQAGSDDPEKREGALVRIEGHVNLNTASRDALRMLIAGRLQQDPQIRAYTDASHSGGANRFPAVINVSPAPDITLIAGRIADAIIRSRPFASTGELANTREWSGGIFTPVFGNARLIPEFAGSAYPAMQWTDSAAEETFARAYDASTVRSRNFRVWIVGQAIAPTASMESKQKVLSETRRSFTLFADPGARRADGSINPAKLRIHVIHENDF